jgi:hypothetical protein
MNVILNITQNSKMARFIDQIAFVAFVRKITFMVLCVIIIFDKKYL